MIIYEVNLEIANTSFDEVMLWLKQHINVMLSYPGFVAAKVYKPEQPECGDFKYVTVMYTLTDRESLQDYFEHHATAMRDDGIKKFGTQFSANRRILGEI